jgi:hypothetical protein
MRKIMLVATCVVLLAMVMVATPAIAQNFRFDNDNDDFNGNRFNRFNDSDGINLDNENELESGPVDQEFSVTNEGDYASQCVPAIQFGNTGNFNNAPSFLQYAGDADDFEPGGIEFSVEPEMDVNCEHTVQQSSAASG